MLECVGLGTKTIAVIASMQVYDHSTILAVLSYKRWLWLPIQMFVGATR